jgi:hypothetical protein
VTDLSAQGEADRPEREGPAPEAPSGDRREGREAAGAGADKPDAAGRRMSETDEIKRTMAAAAGWQGPALAAQIVDAMMRRLIDEGLPNSGPVTNINVSGAHGENLYISGRDQLHTGKSRVRPEAAKRGRLVPAGQLELVKDVYVRPTGITVAEGLFQVRRLVILQGARDSGLRTSGLWLAAMYASTDRVFFLSPDRLLGALRARELEKGAAYVIPSLDAATASKIGESALEDLEAWTADGGWLVITVSTSVSLNREIAMATDLVVKEISRPDPVAVADGHAQRELGEPAIAQVPAPEALDRLRGWLGEDDIREWLRARPEPRFAAQAGRVLAWTALKGGDPRGALRPLEDPQAQAAQWFAVHPDTAKRAFMLAAAVLAGSSYIAVADAAAALYDKLKGFKVKHERQDFWSGLAEESWLELAQEDHATPLGMLPVEVVRFRSARTQTAMLEYAWRRVDGMRLATCEWLTVLGASESTEIRARAAAAAGIVALWDFEYALGKILLPWAASENADEREAAALALSIPANNTRFSDATWRLVLGWCDPELTENTELTRTAIYALGGPLGAQDPETALAALREVVENHDWERVPDVALSLVVLAAGGRSAEVLSTLLEWTSRTPNPTPLNRELRLVGLTCFLICANALAATPGHASRPVILDPSGKGLLPSADLWGRALETSSVRSWAVELLHGWCELRDSGDEDEDGYVLDLVRAIAGLSDRQRERLEYHCYQWANDPHHPSKTARDALEFLHRPEPGTKAIR